MSEKTVLDYVQFAKYSTPEEIGKFIELKSNEYEKQITELKAFKQYVEEHNFPFVDLWEDYKILEDKIELGKALAQTLRDEAIGAEDEIDSIVNRVKELCAKRIDEALKSASPSCTKGEDKK
jgi:hypothetical protein